MTHNYVSTACHHELHDRCRKQCKFCAQPCGCWCHSKSISERAAEAETTDAAVHRQA